MKRRFSKIDRLYLLASVLCVSGVFLALFVVAHFYFGAALFFFGCLIFIFSWLHRNRPRFPRLVSKLRMVLVILLAIGTAYFCFLEILILRDGQAVADDEADYIIVLGAGLNGTVPSLSLRYRLDATLDYLNAHPQAIAIVSGGQGSGEDMTEAQCMYDWLTARGISRERIMMESQATSTMENLTYSKDIIEALSPANSPKIGVVSSEYHIHRAKLMARKVGIDDPVGIPARTGFVTIRINYYIREAFGLTHFYVFGN